LEKAAQMLRTGKPISGPEGVQLGLFYKEVDSIELIDTAIELAREVATGKTRLEQISKDPLPTPDRLADLDLGHPSQAIDKILIGNVGNSLVGGIDSFYKAILRLINPAGRAILRGQRVQTHRAAFVHFHSRV